MPKYDILIFRSLRYNIFRRFSEVLQGGFNLNMLFILLCIAIFLILLILLITYICFRIVFYVPRNKKIPSDSVPLPEGEIYEPYHPLMKKWILEARNYPHENYYIQSHDRLTLHAKYYEYAPDAVTEIMFHGYRGSAERDLSGGIQRCFALGRNVLLVDQRTSCGSEGNVISFGINEHRDCLAWIDFTVKHFGPNVRIVLTGISMGGFYDSDGRRKTASEKCCRCIGRLWLLFS